MTITLSTFHQKIKRYNTGKYGKKVFEEESSDTDDEDDEVGDRHYIYTYLNNLHRLTPYNNIDISRLNSTLLDKEITIEDTLNIIKHIKNTAPGNSGINKVILSTLPKKAIQALTKILNATLSDISLINGNTH